MGEFRVVNTETHFGFIIWYHGKFKALIRGLISNKRIDNNNIKECLSLSTLELWLLLVGTMLLQSWVEGVVCISPRGVKQLSISPSWGFSHWGKPHYPTHSTSQWNVSLL